MACSFVATLTSCYDAPRPSCGFVCGPAGECPTGYRCSVDSRCYLEEARINDCTLFPDGGDTVPPSVISTIPAAGTSHPIDDPVIVRFSEPVIGVNATAFRLALRSDFGEDALIPGTVTYDRQLGQATYDPTESLPEGATISVMLSRSITDLAGHKLDAASFVFITVGRDEQPPLVSFINPPNNQQNVSEFANVAVTFNEPVTGQTESSVLLTADGLDLQGVVGIASGSTVTFDPFDSLIGNTEHFITVTTEIRDLAGNFLQMPVQSRFVTGPDGTPPFIRSRFPAPNENGVDPATVIQFYASEPLVNVNSGSVVLQTGGMQVPAFVTYDPFQRRVELSPNTILAPSTTYFVTVAQSVVDRSGNSFVDAPIAWLFTTGPLR